jgi:AcrR family transcriptional regulator
VSAATRERAGRTGRRPGPGDTRGRILETARASFGERGFDGTTIRSVALAAGVDPALVHHYFGTKQQLFVAGLELPIDFGGDVPAIGRRARRRTVHARPGRAGAVAMVGLCPRQRRSVAAGMLRDLGRGPFAAISDRPDARLRATLVGSQLVGLAMARYIVKVEPLASAAPEAVARAIGPTIQRYLAGDLVAAAPEARPATPERSSFQGSASL